MSKRTEIILRNFKWLGINRGNTLVRLNSFTQYYNDNVPEGNQEEGSLLAKVLKSLGCERVTIPQEEGEWSSMHIPTYTCYMINKEIGKGANHPLDLTPINMTDPKHQDLIDRALVLLKGEGFDRTSKKGEILDNMIKGARRWHSLTEKQASFMSKLIEDFTT